MTLEEFFRFVDALPPILIVFRRIEKCTREQFPVLWRLTHG